MNDLWSKEFLQSDIKSPNLMYNNLLSYVICFTDLLLIKI